MAGLVSSNLETSGTISFKSAILRGHQGRRNSGDLIKDPEEATCWPRTTSSPVLPPAPRAVSNLHFPQIPEHNNFPSLSRNEWALKKKKRKKEMNGLKWASIAEKNKNCKTNFLDSPPPAQNGQPAFAPFSLPARAKKRPLLSQVYIFTCASPQNCHKPPISLLGTLVNWLSFCFTEAFPHSRKFQLYQLCFMPLSKKKKHLN